MKSETWSRIATITLWVFGIILLALIVMLRQDGLKCISNPLPYGIEKIEEVNNASFTCECRFLKGDTPTMLLTSEGWKVKEREGFKAMFSDLNITLIKENINKT